MWWVELCFFFLVCGGVKVIKNGGLRSGREDLQEEIRDGWGDKW